MTNALPDLAGIVNASGFMLQIALESAVEETQQRHGFELEAHEHPWRSLADGGFIDLILGRSTVRLVCECKRSRDANWVFPVEETAEPEDRARFFWTKHTSRGLLSGWFNFRLATSSPQSLYCMIRGSGENETPLLERMSGKLITSVEALGAEEAAIRSPGDDRDDLRVYVPVIITTARLWVCRYDAKKIALETGSGRDLDFEEVPSVRFRKAFSAATPESQADPTEMPYRAFRRRSREQERSVLIVNAAAFVPLLESWRDAVVSESSGWPAEWRPV